MTFHANLFQAIKLGTRDFQLNPQNPILISKVVCREKYLDFCLLGALGPSFLPTRATLVVVECLVTFG